MISSLTQVVNSMDVIYLNDQILHIIYNITHTKIQTCTHMPETLFHAWLLIFKFYIQEHTHLQFPSATKCLVRSNHTPV